MTAVLSTVAAAVAVFASTNVDDLLVLTVLFISSRRSGRPTRAQVVWGQYAGIGSLLAASAAVAAGLLLVPDPWTGLLGLLPVALGIRALLRLRRSDGDRGDGEGTGGPGIVTGGVGVAGVTIANGADNIAVYVPVLRTAGPADAAILLAVFAVLVAVWCAAAAWLGGHERVTRVVDRVGHWLVPVAPMVRNVGV